MRESETSTSTCGVSFFMHAMLIARTIAAWQSSNLISLLYNLTLPQHKCCVISKDMPTIQRQPHKRPPRKGRQAGRQAEQSRAEQRSRARNPLLTLLICHFNKFIL